MSPRHRIGRYRIVAPLSHGGMSEILLTSYRDPEGALRPAAVKVLASRLRAEPTLVRQFRHEARVLNSLRHPNVVCGIELGREDGIDYLAMELLTGETVRTLIQLAYDRGEPIPLEVSLFIAWSAAAGLHASHELRDVDGRSVQLVHRDIAPENIYVTSDGTVKVIDFGIANSRANENRAHHPLLDGRHGYSAPELARRDAVDRRADVYSVGVVLYELLTGARPPATGLRAPLPERYPPRLHALLDRALAHDPAQRHPTAGHLQLDIAHAAAEAGAAMSPEVVASYLGRRYRHTGDLDGGTTTLSDPATLV